MDFQREFEKINNGLQEMRQDLNDIADWCEEHDEHHTKAPRKEQKRGCHCQNQGQNPNQSQNQGQNQPKPVDNFRANAFYVKDNCHLPTALGPYFCNSQFLLRLAGLNNSLNFQLIRGIGCPVEIELDSTVGVEQEASETEEASAPNRRQNARPNLRPKRKPGQGLINKSRRKQLGGKKADVGAETEPQKANVIKGVICNAGTNFVDVRLKNNKVVTILSNRIRQITWPNSHCNPCDMHHHPHHPHHHGICAPLLYPHNHFPHGSCGQPTCRTCHPRISGYGS